MECLVALALFCNGVSLVRGQGRSEKEAFLKSTMVMIQKQREESASPTSFLPTLSSLESFQEDKRSNQDIEGTKSSIFQLAASESPSYTIVYNGSSLPYSTYDNYGTPAETGEIPGYYYYYYPLPSHSFKGGGKGGGGKVNTKQNGMSISEMLFGDTMPSSMKDEETKNENMKPEDVMMAQTMEQMKSVEPLFTAMAGFVGVAMMIATTILFLPKFGKLKSRGIIVKQGQDEFSVFTNILSESLRGKDCSHLVACQVGKTVRTMHLGTNTIRIMELILPESLGKQLARIRRSALKKEKCTYLKCKEKSKVRPNDKL